MRVLPLLPLSLLVGACASSPADRYPSLAIRAIERVEGTALPVEPAPRPAPSEPGPELLARLDRLAADARDAHAGFLAGIEQAEAAVAAAAGAELGTDAWVEAQTKLAGLEAQRSRTMIALADLDLLHVADVLDGGATGAIAERQAETNALVEQENAVLERLYAMLAAQAS